MAKEHKAKPEVLLLPAHEEPKAPEKLAPKRGMGHIDDDYAGFVASTRSRFGAPVSVPNEASVEQYVLGIKNQGETSSCVGHALATAVDTRLRVLGIKAEQCSSIGAYTLARTLGRSSEKEALVDVGSMPYSAIQALKEYGIPTEPCWPFNPKEVNTELPLDVLLNANHAKVTNVYRVDSYGASRADDAKLALSKGYPLVFAITVDQAFNDYTGGVVNAFDGKTLGGHMLCLVGYRTLNGKTQYRGVNSWGTSWGESGMFWLSEERFLSARDIYAIEVQP